MRLGGAARLHDSRFWIDIYVDITSKRVAKWHTSARLCRTRLQNDRNFRVRKSRWLLWKKNASRTDTHLNRQAGLNLSNQRHAGRLLFLLRSKHRSSRSIRGKAQSADIRHVLDRFLVFNLHHVLVHCRLR